MSEFLLEFTEFNALMFSELVTLFNWFTSTIIGKILIFMILISIFWYLLRIFIFIKD